MHLRSEFAILLVSALFVTSSVIHAQTASSSSRIAAEQLFVESQKALSRGDNEAAERYLKDALKKDASFTSAIWQLSQIYEKRGKLEYARELLLRGLQQEPNVVWAKDKLARLENVLVRRLLLESERYMEAGEYNRAIPKLSLYLGIKPYDPVPLIMLGRCHLALGNLEAAKSFFSQALERDPSDTEVLALAKETESRIDRTSLSSAINSAQELLSDYSPENNVRIRAALETVLALDPGNTWAREKLGELEILSAEAEVKSADNDDKNRETAAGGRETVPGGREAATGIRESVIGAVKRVRVKDYALLLLLAVVGILLVIDIRRRQGSRSHPLQGSLTLMPILDIVSLINSNLKTGRLVIHTDNAKGEIYFEKGEIIHARWKGFDGKKAFHKMMDLRIGNYYYKNHLPNIKHTIAEPLSLLLLSMKSKMEAAKSSRRSSDEEYTTTVYR